MRGIIDSTLREGEQQAHLYFSTPQKFEIINLLQAVGVEEIELGIDSADSDLGSLVDQDQELLSGAASEKTTY